jgi:nitroreductase
MFDFSGQKITDLIKKRVSVRTYSRNPVEKEKLDAVSGFLDNKGNPFGAEVRIRLLECETTSRIGAYGLIRGASVYLAGCVKKGGYDLEGFGFEFERAILFAAALGLSTCWVGGLFTRGAFSAAMKPEGEWLPAISPVGYRAEKKSIIEKAVAAGAGSRNRLPFEELFFDGEGGKPLKAEGPIKDCLEMVRIAPSASNRQPWRAIKTETGIHFYLRENKGYAGNTLFGFCMQRIDMGIAACHFELAAQETGLSGGVVFDDPKLLSDSETVSRLSYSFTWR